MNGHPDPNKNLLAAVLAVQAEAPTLPKDGHNPAFGGSRFATLTMIVEKVGPILNQHGLVWMAFPGGTAEAPSLKYSLLHPESGEGIHGDMPLLLSKNDLQGFGSALTYARRYCLCAVLNLVADDDDDGNAAGRSHANSDEPTEAQRTALRRQVTMNKPTVGVLGKMLKAVGLNASDQQILSGSWANMVTRQQVSGLLYIFKGGVLPTGQSDIPNDAEPAPDVEPGDDLPFDPVGPPPIKPLSDDVLVDERGRQG